jgi:hypothetical protein
LSCTINNSWSRDLLFNFRRNHVLTSFGLMGPEIEQKVGRDQELHCADMKNGLNCNKNNHGRSFFFFFFFFFAPS